MVLEPCLTSLGVLVLRLSRLRFVAGAFLDLDKDDGGFSNGFGGSARRIDLGRNVGRGVSGDDAALAFGSSRMGTFSITSVWDFDGVFGWSSSMIPLLLDDLACKLRRASRSLRFCFVAASFLLYIRPNPKIKDIKNIVPLDSLGCMSCSRTSAFETGHCGHGFWGLIVACFITNFLF